MYARTRRMLFRHYLQQWLSKAEVAPNLGVSHRTIDQRIEAGQFIPELDDGPACYGPRAPVPRLLDPYRGISQTQPSAYPPLTATRMFAGDPLYRLNSATRT